MAFVLKLQNMSFSTLRLTFPKEFVAHVEFTRPEELNSFNKQQWEDIRQCFKQLREKDDVRAVVFSASGKHFTAGLDLKTAGELMKGGKDPARNAFKFKNLVSDMQESFNAIEDCGKPVIAAIHGGCIGAGVDMITACDIRYCTQETFFSVKEVDIAMAADVGTLQRLPKVTGNDSLCRELCFTGRRFSAKEALQLGLVSKILENREELLDSAFALALEISNKSPIAVTGTKHILNYSRDHSVREGLNYVSTWNGAMLQTKDMEKAVMASMSKTFPTFSKL